jgi:serine/threonine protein kinase/dipeptidyl aminopeptidase/acylaminoacyl peptidase
MGPGDRRDGVLAPGARVGPYDVTERIGGGGMGEVYRARDARFGRDVALKVLPASFASDAERLWRFEQEARAAGMIDHPGILVVHDFGAHEGRAYLATELLEGESLRERLASGPLPGRKAVDLAAQIARALAAAHEKGIVHRDLKPDNVFLTRDGRAKILDFGLAKLERVPSLEVDRESDTLASPLASGTSPGVLLGTMAYLSPEQARGRPADARSDIFALGLVFYEMLTGGRAFARGSMVETLNAILKEDAAEMKTASGPVPTSLDRLVRRCLEKDPDERFQTARDLAFALEALGSGLESESQALLSPEAWRRRWWTVPALARGLGFLALAGLLVAGAGGLLRRPLPPRITSSRPLLNGFPGQPVAWVTDGERVYFSLLRDGRFQTFQMSLAGGEPAPLAVPTRHAVVMDVSKKRSALLVAGWDGGVSDPRYRDVPVWMVPLPAGSPMRLPASGVSAAWSPDGETIAYVGGSDNYAQKSPSLFVARTDGSGSRPLWAPADATVWSATWSRDGRWLLVGLYDRGKGESWVGEMPSDGSRPPRRLARTVAATWTPDRRTLVGQVGGEAIGAQTPAERRRVNLFAQRRRQWDDLWREPEPMPLSFGPMNLFAPVVTPDGRSILAGGSLVRTEPLRFNRATGQFERLPGGITGGFIDYSPDGAWVAWVDATDRTLWRARSDGNERLQLTLPPLEVALVRWSPDGSRLAFVGGRSDDPDVVYLVPRDGGAPEALSKPDPAGAWDPCWLPDGQTLVWGSLRIPEGSIKTLDMRTRQVSVVPGSQRMMGPKCSPQGAILADKEWSQGWWLYHPDSRTWEDFWRGSTSASLSYPTWSHDGRAIYGLSLDQRAVFRLTVEGRRVEKVASLGPIEPTAPSQQPWMGLDPDDAPVILRNTGMWDLYVLDWEAP